MIKAVKPTKRNLETVERIFKKALEKNLIDGGYFELDKNVRYSTLNCPKDADVKYKGIRRLMPVNYICSSYGDLFSIDIKNKKVKWCKPQFRDGKTKVKELLKKSKPETSRLRYIISLYNDFAKKSDVKIPMYFYRLVAIVFGIEAADSEIEARLESVKTVEDYLALSPEEDEKKKIAVDHNKKLKALKSIHVRSKANRKIIAENCKHLQFVSKTLNSALNGFDGTNYDVNTAWFNEIPKIIRNTDKPIEIIQYTDGGEVIGHHVRVLDIEALPILTPDEYFSDDKTVVNQLCIDEYGRKWVRVFCLNEKNSIKYGYYVTEETENEEDAIKDYPIAVVYEAINTDNL